MRKITKISLGVIGVSTAAIIAANVSGGSSDGADAPAPAATHAAQPSAHKAAPKPTHKAASKPQSHVVVFKVWGNAPAGVLGPLDLTYGSDSDDLTGHYNGHSWSATLTQRDQAMYYDVMAQLQGSGDVHCSVTVDGKTKTAHASGGYNICDAQLSDTGFGWS